MSEVALYDMNAVTVNYLVNTFGDKPEDAKTVYNATSNAISLHEKVGEKLEVAGVIMERGARNDRRSGEQVPCINSYIVTTDGNAYYSQSEGVARGLVKIVNLTGDFRTPDGGPISIVVNERKLDNGNILKVVEWL